MFGKKPRHKHHIKTVHKVGQARRIRHTREKVYGGKGHILCPTIKKLGPFPYVGELEEPERKWIEQNIVRYRVGSNEEKEKVLDEWMDYRTDLIIARRNLRQYEREHPSPNNYYPRYRP